MRYTLRNEHTEPIINLTLDDREEYVYVMGQNEKGKFIIGIFTNDGKFQPHKVGCKQLGLTIDDTFNK